MGSINLSELVRHIADSVKHITAAERTAWNSKAESTHNHTKSNITDLSKDFELTDYSSKRGQLTISKGESYDVIIRFDGSNFYILQSDEHGGNYNSSRPLIINSSGICDINGNAANAKKVNGRHSSRIPTLNASGVLWDSENENNNDAFIQWDGSTYFKLKTQHNKTMVDNADMLDGYHAADLIAKSGVSGSVSRPTSSPYSQTITLGFKPSCIIAMTAPFAKSNTGSYVPNTTNAALIVGDSGTVYGHFYDVHTSSAPCITITKTTTGFTAAFSSTTDSGTASFCYIAFK